MSEISPLFAVDVEHLIRNGFYEDAILLCEEGLKEYPDYPAAIALLAKAYASLGDSQTAQNIIDDAGKNYSAYKVIQNAQENINNIEQDIIENKEFMQNNSNNEFDLDSLIAENNITNFELENEKTILIDEIVTEELNEVEKEEIIDEIIGVSFGDDSNFDIESFIDESIEKNVIEIESDNFEELISAETVIEDISGANSYETIQESKLIPWKFDFESESIFDKSIKYSAANPFSIYGISDLIIDFRNQKTKKIRNLNLLEIESSLKSYRDTPYEIYPELAFGSQIQAVNSNQKSMYDDDYEEYAKPTVITETIANILYQQGAIDEAIEAYQKLSELYPEKSDYFNNKIVEINSIEFSINQ